MSHKINGVLENKFSDDFKDAIHRNGGYAVSVVASLYMAGQPDLDITSAAGVLLKAELKVHRATSVPTVDSVMGLLRGPQRNVIPNKYWRRNAECPIIAQIAAQPAACCILYKKNLSFDLWENVAKILARLPFGQRTPWFN